MSVFAVHEDTMYLDQNGRRMPVYIASPDTKEKRPGVIVIHEIFGLDEHIKDIARRFAHIGLVAYAPDLFADVPGVPDNRKDLDKMRGVWQSVPDQQFIHDLKAVFELAHMAPTVERDKIGAIGYCMGGAMAYMFAGSEPRLTWCGDYYGRVEYPSLSDTKTKNPIDYTDTIKCPVLGLFAGKDQVITVDQVHKLEERLKKDGVPHEVHIYPEASHAFFNDQREHYDAAAAKDAWKRTLEFISKATKTALPS